MMMWTLAAHRHQSAIARSSLGSPQREKASIMHVTTIALNVAKHIFHVHVVDAPGNIVTSKWLCRLEGSLSFAGMSSRLKGFEECATFHYWAPFFEFSREGIARTSESRLSWRLPLQTVSCHIRRMVLKVMVQ